MAPTDPAAPAAPARRWPIALLLAAAALYVPQLLPLVATDVTRQATNLGAYARLFPVLAGVPPGVSARIASGLPDPPEEVVFWSVAVLVTLLLLGGTALALRRWRRSGPVVAGAVALLSAALSMAAVGIIQA